jgi:peptide/nickel transport system ATP-binding protein
MRRQSEPLLVVNGLSVSFDAGFAVDDVSFTIHAGQRIGLVGESGSGKSMTALAITGLQPEGAKVEGRILFDGSDLTSMGEDELCRVRGRQIGTIFQDPMTALNPVEKVGKQVAEVIRLHEEASRTETRSRVLDLFERVKLPEPESMTKMYPHQLSGGQKQRVIIAMALACRPRLIIADEPTTALDVTVQAEILRLLVDVIDGTEAALLFITHDLNVVASMCDDILVLYGGKVLECGPSRSVLQRPRSPYTAGLLNASPTGTTVGRRQRLDAIPGTVPPLGGFPDGCSFRDRCARATDACDTTPRLEGSDHQVACWNPMGTEMNP